MVSTSGVLYVAITRFLHEPFKESASGGLVFYITKIRRGCKDKNLGEIKSILVDIMWPFPIMMSVMKMSEHSITTPQSPPSQGGDKGEVINNSYSLSLLRKEGK